VTHFLSRLLTPGTEAGALVNERTGSVVADVLEIAVDSTSRRRGLLGRDGLPEDHALVLAPCNAVHTFFMRFPIDVAFVARDGRVVKTVEGLGAWRVAMSPRAFATIEFPAGVLRSRLVSGDRVVVQRPVERSAPPA
jgi:uncharacterized membrane protein (UPF0127 family)